MLELKCRTISERWKNETKIEMIALKALVTLASCGLVILVVI
jgi:hypothetical protein